MKKQIFTLLAIIFAITASQAQHWQTIGEEGFSHTTLCDNMPHDITFSADGTPYVIYGTETEKKDTLPSRVVKFNGTEWETVGEDNIITEGAYYRTIYDANISFDASGDLFIAYHNNFYGTGDFYHTFVKMVWDHLMFR